MAIKKLHYLIYIELQVLYYAIFGWFKSPANMKNVTVYPYHKTSQLKMFVIVFAILIVLEGGLFHFVLQIWSHLAAWIFTVLNIYALLYIVGLYHSVRTLPHTIHAEKLVIRYGYQSSIELDIKNIESIKNAKKQGGIEDKPPKDTYYALLQMDSPHYEITLKEPILMKRSYGKSKWVKTVVFRADEPAAMREHIEADIKLL
ncbi:hypothetical protein [Oceanobacillus jordanicus]|uniref:Uncharacterized protein n=1 Tax=Oceanobacillus jordanicus TaxID=2867266 RepID=A0AAW5BBZ5_9BACI|nr:hypothetical protein [Oceanobacillus jordanicus]MCG3420597.1 hypothetical protein [Oceanobacillus jordanicus]